MARVLKADKEALVESYRKQVEYFVDNKREFKVIRKKISLLYNYFKGQSSIDGFVDYSEEYKLLEGVRSTLWRLLLEDTDMVRPLTKVSLDDKYYEILMYTPRETNSLFNLEKLKGQVKSFNELFDKELNSFLSNYTNVAHQSKIQNDKLYIMEDQYRYIYYAKEDRKGETYIKMKTIHYEYDSSDSDENKKLLEEANSFLDLLKVYSSNSQYHFESGNPIADNYIKECFPAMAI